VAVTCPSGTTVGGTGTCALTVANAGPASASKVIAAVLLPAALSEVSCTGGCTRHGNVYTWTLASRASSASAKFTITIKVSKTGTAPVLAVAASREPRPQAAEQLRHRADQHQALTASQEPRHGLSRTKTGAA
jgi:hypothetical protein